MLLGDSVRQLEAKSKKLVAPYGGPPVYLGLRIRPIFRHKDHFLKVMGFGAAVKLKETMCRSVSEMLNKNC